MFMALYSDAVREFREVRHEVMLLQLGLVL